MQLNNMFLNDLSIKLFADLGDPQQINSWIKQPFIKGLTTNPSLMSDAKIHHYEFFARSITDNFPEMPVSFEILADNFSEMIAQATIINRWGTSVFVKIPIVNCQGDSTLPVIQALILEGIAVNITAIMTETQIVEILPALDSNAKLIFSVFCGRIADTGRDPVPVMQRIAKLLLPYTNRQLLWASSRELLNIFQAIQAGCDIITLNESLLNKLNLINKDLTQYSIETVQQFYQDGRKVRLK